MTSAHSDHRLVQPTIWTCDDDADRSPSKSDGVVDLSVQHGHQLLAVLYHPLAPVFAGSRSHRLVFHQAAHSLSVKEASHERGSVAFPPSDCSVVDSLPSESSRISGYSVYLNYLFSLNSDLLRNGHSVSFFLAHLYLLYEVRAVQARL